MGSYELHQPCFPEWRKMGQILGPSTTFMWTNSVLSLGLCHAIEEFCEQADTGWFVKCHGPFSFKPSLWKLLGIKLFPYQLILCFICFCFISYLYLNKLFCHICSIILYIAINSLWNMDKLQTWVSPLNTCLLLNLSLLVISLWLTSSLTFWQEY